MNNSISENIIEIAESPVTDIVELGVDSFIGEGILKDLPATSIGFSLIKIGLRIKEEYDLEKLRRFVEAINRGISSPEHINEIREKLYKGGRQTEKELKHIGLLIDQYIDELQSDILAVFYLSYLNGKLSWDDLIVCGMTIKDLPPSNVIALTGSRIERSDTRQRLTSKGIIRDHYYSVGGGPQISKEELTRFGEMFRNCLIEYPEIVKPIEKLVRRRGLRQRR